MRGDGPAPAAKPSSITRVDPDPINLPVLGAEPKKQICATNVAFGDADGKTLYVAACDAVYEIRLKVGGVLEGPEHVQ